MLGFNSLSCLVDEELHAVQFNQQVVGEFDIGFVHLIDQQHHLLIGIKGFPQLATLDVIGDIMHLLIAQLGIPQARNRIVLI